MVRHGRLSLVTYDLDGTLIDGTAFLLVARAFGFEKEVLYHDARFRSGEITLQECFDIEFGLLKGKTLAQVDQAMAAGTWFPGIREGVQALKDNDLAVALLTDNPDFVADHTGHFGIDHRFCSRSENEGDVISGIVHPSFDKWGNLRSYLDTMHIDPQHVCHVGNDVNDVKVWEHVGLGVCVEPTGPAVAAASDLLFPHLRDHRDVAEAVLRWHNGASVEEIQAWIDMRG